MGADRLAALLMDLAEGDTAIRKRLVLAAAEAGGEDALIKALDRRLSALASSRSYIAWEKARAYASELDGLRAALAENLAPLNARAAAERLSRFIGMAPRIFERVDDSDGRLGDVFRTAVLDLAASWKRIGDYDQNTMAADVLSLVQADEYGVCDGLVTAAAPTLGPSGLTALADRVRAALAEDRQADTPEARWSRLSLRGVLRDVADAQQDVDAERRHVARLSKGSPGL